MHSFSHFSTVPTVNIESFEILVAFNRKQDLRLRAYKRYVSPDCDRVPEFHITPTVVGNVSVREPNLQCLFLVSFRYSNLSSN